MSKTLLKTINVGSPELLKLIEELHANGANISHICREAIKKAHAQMVKLNESGE